MSTDRDDLIFLAIETTCDETAAAVLQGPRPPRTGVPRIRSSVVASQVGLHQRYGGVVPEIASREHVRQILPMIDEALRRAGVSLSDLGAVAVATRPGLVGALVVGLTAAKALALALEVPLIAVDHLEGHLYACQLAYPDRDVFPCAGLVVSGDTPAYTFVTARLNMSFSEAQPTTRRAKRSTRWPACSAWDIPAVPRLSAAHGGNSAAFAFPRSFLHDERLIWSFSGLKTAVLYALGGQNARQVPADLDASLVSDVAASFQQAVVDVIVAKTRQGLKSSTMKRLGVGGGVAANSVLRRRLIEMAAALGVEVFIPPLALCTDNAAMGGIALAKLAAGQVASLDIDVTAGLVRPGRGI